MRNDRDENNPQELLAIDRYIDWSRNWQLTPVFLPGKFHRQRKLAGYGPWGCRVWHDWACTHPVTWKWSRSVVSDSFATPWTVAHQAPLSMGFSRQEYWRGLPFSSPGDLPDPGIKPRSPALQADTLPSEPPEWQWGKVNYKVLVKGEFNTMKHSFYKRLFASHEDLISPWRDLVLL